MKAYWAMLTILVSTGVFHSPVYAALTLDTANLVIATPKNKSVTKTLVVSSDAEIQQLEVMATDLVRTDFGSSIPAQGIQAVPASAQLNANGSIPVQITVPSDQIVNSGEFTGSLLILYDDNRQILPIILRVKDPSWKPWLALIVGVALGLGFSWYRASGMLQDELVVKVGRLRTQMRGEEAVQAQRFKEQVEAYLIEVETAFNDKAWETANAETENAQKIWNRWLKGRNNWIAQIDYRQSLLDKVNSSPMKGQSYGEAVTAHLEDAERQVATYNTSQDFRDHLKTIRMQIDHYGQGQGWLDQIFKLEDRLVDPSRKTFWGDQRVILEQSLNALTPDDQAKFEAWEEDVKQAAQSLLNELESTPKAASAMQGVAERGALLRFSPPSIGPVPEARTFADEISVQQARWQLKSFRIIGQLVTVSLLAWLGMSELYEGKPTFGATPITDYFGLFAWGFGAEVSREAIVKATGNLGLGNGKSEKSSES